jgi:hypothetical protein
MYKSDFSDLIYVLFTTNLACRSDFFPDLIFVYY